MVYKHFNFVEEISKEKLPAYVHSYVYADENICKAYKTKRDRSVFTDIRLILFDTNLITKAKSIRIIPYKSISSSEIYFKKTNAFIFFSFDNGDKMKLNFLKLSPKDKTELRKLYYKIMKNVK